MFSMSGRWQVKGINFGLVRNSWKRKGRADMAAEGT